MTCKCSSESKDKSMCKDASSKKEASKPSDKKSVK